MTDNNLQTLNIICHLNQCEIYKFFEHTVHESVIVTQYHVYYKGTCTSKSYNISVPCFSCCEQLIRLVIYDMSCPGDLERKWFVKGLKI